MKKVVYGISRYRNNDVAKLTGVGYITDEDLIIACLSKSQKPYLRVFEGCVKHVNIFIVVVLPAPFTPNSENNSPLLISKLVKCGDYQVINPTLLSVSTNIKFSFKPHYI